MPKIDYEFGDSLLEVNELLLLAEDDAKKGQAIVSALNKAALILLAAKFESFIENIVDTYVFHINQSDVTRKSLPAQIRYNHFRSTLSPLLDNNNLPIEKTEEMCRKIADFFTNDECEIKVNSKFNYGKHGSKEVIKLLSKIGIVDTFGCFTPMNQDIEVDVAGDIDSMTFIRNNIIHGDADPALSTEQIRGYLFKFDLWAHCLVDVMNYELNSILKA